MREYQPTKNPYLLPREVYMQALWAIRDYNRTLAEYNAIPEESPPPPDGMPKGTNVGKIVESQAIRRMKLKEKLDAVDYAKDKLPAEYRDGVWNNIVFKMRYPDYAGSKTWGKYKSMMAYYTAKELGIL